MNLHPLLTDFDVSLSDQMWTPHRTVSSVLKAGTSFCRRAPKSNDIVVVLLLLLVLVSSQYVYAPFNLGSTFLTFCLVSKEKERNLFLGLVASGWFC
ncbi:hypothetical protein VNO77_21510 [Canavalia gladiata]|uniref:Transmembrane protein n=1 Tax=Canavalia gladiata TaxID=3824 RepID=A0AAN9LRF4_CANGL